MYIVRNLTNKPVFLSDIRSEIGPYKIIDLEYVVSRDNIERSNDLKHALNSRKLQFVKQTVIRVPSIKTDTPKIIEKTVEVRQPAFDEDKLKDIVRSVVKEQFDATNHTSAIEDSVHKAMSSGMNKVMDTLRDKLNSINVQPQASNHIDVAVDPGKLAEMQQKVVDKLAQEIDVNKIKQGKKIKLVDPKISDLANEL